MLTLYQMFVHSIINFLCNLTTNLEENFFRTFLSTPEEHCTMKCDAEKVARIYLNYNQVKTFSEEDKKYLEECFGNYYPTEYQIVATLFYTLVGLTGKLINKKLACFSNAEFRSLSNARRRRRTRHSN